MSIDGTKKLGDWGKLIPTTNNGHITQTNANSDDGKAVHDTTNIRGTQFKVQTRFNSDGNYLDSNFAKR